MKNSLAIIKIGLVILIFAGCKKSEDSSMLSAQSNTIQDIDGNVYKIVTIGTQVWMASNLKTTKYNDGTAIPLVADNKAWQTRNGPAYCWYNNEEAAYKNTYGALYNFYTVDHGKLCPTGWHLPSYKEWTTLINFLGGENAAGGKLKEAGTSHWNSPNTGATNATGFTALPGGSRNQFAMFGNLGQISHWWGSDPYNNDYAWAREMWYNNSGYYLNHFTWQDGFSVRCLKN